jgi:hypothetical protein
VTGASLDNGQPERLSQGTDAGTPGKAVRRTGRTWSYGREAQLAVRAGRLGTPQSPTKGSTARKPRQQPERLSQGTEAGTPGKAVRRTGRTWSYGRKGHLAVRAGRLGTPQSPTKGSTAREPRQRHEVARGSFEPTFHLSESRCCVVCMPLCEEA